MKIISKKSIIMLLCLLLAMPLALTSCITPTGNSDSVVSGTTTSDEASSTNNAHGGYDKATDKYFVNMPANPAPDIKEFKVLVLDNTTETTYYSEEVGVDKYTTTDLALTEAVRKRNNMVFEKYGVEIKAVYSASVYTDLAKDVLGDTGAYDAAMPFLMQCPALAQAGSLYDLATFSDYIDLSMPWWDQNATESLSIDDKVYFTTGDISIMQKIVSVAVTFNKDMLKKSYPDVDLYKMVEDGEWTLDKMIEYSTGVTQDSTGDGLYTYDDTWGLSASYGDAAMFYLASGERLITKNAEDIPVLSIGGEKSITVAQKILSDLQIKNVWAIHCQEFGLTGYAQWQKSLDIFGENRALFRTSAFSAIKKLRNYDNGAAFGVIPMPKFDAAQENYYTPCSATLAYGIVIPLSAPNPDFSAFMIEVMACEAKNYITDAYYTTILKGKDMTDDQSEVMLDKYIFNNVVYDLGIIYNFGTVSGMFNTLMTDNSADITSTLGSAKAGIETAITDVVTKYRSLE